MPSFTLAPDPRCLPRYLVSQLGGFSPGSTGQWLNKVGDFLNCSEHLSVQGLERKWILARDLDEDPCSLLCQLTPLGML